MIKILITSISNKTPLIEAIRKSLMSKGCSPYIIGGDGNFMAIAKHFVDEFWHMPALKDLKVEEIIDYCWENEIKIIIPTRDGELSYFAKNKELFEQKGIQVMVSSQDSLHIALDKLFFYEYLNDRSFPVIPTSLHINFINADLYVVKERMGAGAKTISVKVSKEEAINSSVKMDAPIFQPFVEGIEYSIDLYMTKNHKPKGIIVRERVHVVDGESQVTKTVRSSEIEELIKKIAIEMKLNGHVMFQVIVDKYGDIHVLECNPRIGGASTLSIYAGLDSFFWWVKEASGNDLDEFIFKQNEKDLTLIRYKKDMII